MTVTADPGAPEPALGGAPVPELYVSGRRKRRAERVRRWLSYLAGAVVIVLVGFAVDWDRVGRKYFSWERITPLFPEIITIAAKNTAIYTAGAFVGGVVLGVSAALLRLSSVRAYRWAAKVYIEIFRGLPALLTIIMVGFITPIALGIKFPRVASVNSAGIVALALVAGAYLAETIRAGIQAVPVGQVEAARSLGLSRAATLRHVIMPQAFRVVIPPLTNEFVLLIKDTSLLSVLGMAISEKDLTRFGRDAANQGYNATPLVAAGIMYLVITIPLTQLVAYLEKRNGPTR